MILKINKKFNVIYQDNLYKNVIFAENDLLFISHSFAM